MQSSAKKALRYLWQKEQPYKPYLVGMLICTLLKMGFELTQPFFYKGIVDSLSNYETLEMGVDLAVLNLLYLLIVIVGRNIFWNLGDILLIRSSVRIMRDVAIEAFRHVQKLSYSFHSSNFAGSTVKKCNRGFWAIDSIIDRVWFDFAPVFLQVTGISLIFAFKAPPLIIILLSGILVFLVATLYLNNKQIPLERAGVRAETKTSGNFHDVVSNIFTVKTFARERSENRRHLRLLNDWKEKALKAWYFHVKNNVVQWIIAGTLELALLYYSINLFKQGVFTVGDIVLVQTYFVTLIQSVWRLSWMYRDFRKATVNLEEMIELLETDPLIKDKNSVKKLKFKKGEIEFRNVDFDYGENDNDAVFENLSLKIKAGEKVALVGPSGSGKTTFVKLLTRLVDVNGGEILIDGKSIQDVTVESLRESIGLVPQDPALFHRPLSENIAYGKPDASIEDIKKASKLAHAHHFIKDLAQGYDTYVGERGVKLSGGERQRVAIARVILENAPIVVFDEATSSLDSLSEKHIQAAFQNLMKGRTTIVVAHRLSTIIDMDRILVFDKGKVVEEGRHEELIQREGSLYKKLWDIQAGGFLLE